MAQHPISTHKPIATKAPLLKDVTMLKIGPKLESWTLSTEIAKKIRRAYEIDMEKAIKEETLPTKQKSETQYRRTEGGTIKPGDWGYKKPKASK